MRLEGVIKKWNDEKGFGFIQPKSGPEIFIHIKGFYNQSRRPVIGDVVTFEIKVDAEGRPQAQQVKFEIAKLALPIPSILSSIYFLAAIGFLVFSGYLAYLGKIPILIFVLYLLASVITFFLYALDKHAARHGNWRTPESTLHLSSVIGGWPGALVAQTALRHKSKKQPFRIVFWLTVLMNCGSLNWLLSADGGVLLHQIDSIEINASISKYIGLLQANSGHKKRVAEIRWSD
ncbi:cold shock and DUF1294 domain-containing protein [Methylomonas sp. UP202]|uniref:cold shock and DUF1294 domain-containing protein n=1 Tax=Methylomonas sp. UP202 TaxID=3040943 RepID=UPI0024790920|nr:cold shock and DUF1294 domain-containing protein [Methylomonas sp. UP202]WGS86329.1 cold shock and DUF1294 domain-containing protein [Methylomonas sp. UP202]